MGAVGVIGQDPGVIEPHPARRPADTRPGRAASWRATWARVRAVAWAMPVFWRSQAAVSRK